MFLCLIIVMILGGLRAILGQDLFAPNLPPSQGVILPQRLSEATGEVCLASGKPGVRKARKPLSEARRRLRKAEPIPTYPRRILRAQRGSERICADGWVNMPKHKNLGKGLDRKQDHMISRLPYAGKRRLKVISVEVGQIGHLLYVRNIIIYSDLLTHTRFIII